MSHKILEAILENGQIINISKSLPPKRMKVHIIYDIEDESNLEGSKLIVKETLGIYKNINAKLEAARLREDWERNANI